MLNFNCQEIPYLRMLENKREKIKKRMQSKKNKVNLRRN